MAQQKVIWGFMLENAYFVEFDNPNHIIIEAAFQQKKLKQTSHYIIIHDSHLPCPARIYFGVIQIHLRMPGTRYYVKRKIVPTSTITIVQQHSQQRPSKHYQRRHCPQQQRKQLQRQNQEKKPSWLLSPSVSSSSTSSSSSSSFSSSSTTTTTLTISTNTSPSTSTSTITMNNTDNDNMNMTMLDKPYDMTFSSSFIDMNSSWLDSIYTAMPLFTNVQALLIPWSTSPPPPSYSNI